MFFAGSHLIAWYGFIKYYFTPLSINLLHFTEILSLVYMNSTNAFWGFPLCLHVCKQKMQYCRIKTAYIKKQDKRRCWIASEYSTLIQLKLYYCYWFECSLFCLGGKNQLRYFVHQRRTQLWTLRGPGSSTWHHRSSGFMRSQPASAHLNQPSRSFLRALHFIPWVWRDWFQKVTSFSDSFLLFIL